MHDVAIARTKAEATEILQNVVPDLAIIAFCLPDGLGREVVAAVRHTGNIAPVLLMSDAMEVVDLADWAFHETDDILPKPFNGDLLRTKVDRLISEHEIAVRSARERAALEALQLANTREADTARRLLDRMTQRSHFDPQLVKVESLSAGQFGGDVVLGQTLPDGKYRWLVGDVTGHTLASALVTIPISLIFYATAKRGVPLVELAVTMDRELGALLPVTMFFAATALELDRVAGTLTLINAGCPDVIIKRANGDLDALESTQPPLGIMKGLLDPLVLTVPVFPGDRILAFTDGLVECCSQDGALFGPERVRQLVGRASSEAAFEKLSAAWRDYAPGTELADDLSIIEVIV